MANDNNNRTGGDRAPTIQKFSYEGADYSGKTLVFRLGNLGDDGLIKKDLHYNFKMPQRCVGRGCKICAHILKSGSKKLNKFKVNNRAALLVQPLVLNEGGEVEWVADELFVIEIGPKVLKRIDELVYVDSVRFDGSSMITGTVKTADLGGRSVTFLDPDSVRIDDVNDWLHTFGNLPEVDGQLYSDTVKFHTEFPKAPTGKLIDMLIDELVAAEGAKNAAPGAGGPKGPGPRPPAAMAAPAAPKAAPKPPVASIGGDKKVAADAAAAVKGALASIDL